MDKILQEIPGLRNSIQEDNSNSFDYEQLRCLLEGSQQKTQIGATNYYTKGFESFGRVGPITTEWNEGSKTGDMILFQNNEIYSNGGFSSIRANTGIFRGKWQYEVQLKTKGLAQIGFYNYY
ncbi:MAG: hypothetical protein EZS28_013834 [Streblomastix strix]|uniref:Uncharacterized protein n=1 Tax=Streblomastix strix TaxID=222440 RepID=A0A5J4W8C5_9EUKA|nr:MAG: hypothetical protein EZS28_013834 [Streblomastix strix]